MKMKKGQAAMEFLMTYGWAILVVLVAIGALAYFGVLSPDKFLPSKCTLPTGSGLSCLSHKATADEVTLVVKNAGGTDLTGVSIQPEGCDADGPEDLANGEQNTFTAGNCSITGSKYSGDVTVSYTDAQDLNHTVSGSITTAVEG